jgi:hypothetical protein
LPKSWREQSLVISIKEGTDPDLIAGRQELVKSMSPSELAQFNSITDIPVPSTITRMFSRDAKNEKLEDNKERRY